MILQGNNTSPSKSPVIVRQLEILIILQMLEPFCTSTHRKILNGTATTTFHQKRWKINSCNYIYWNLCHESLKWTQFIVYKIFYFHCEISPFHAFLLASSATLPLTGTKVDSITQIFHNSCTLLTHLPISCWYSL